MGLAMRRVLIAIVLMGCISGTLSPLTVAQSTQQSQLAQQITPRDCSGHHCMPTVARAMYREGHPLIVGTYDPTYTARLQVIFNGKTYTLGVDSELTADRGVWTLALGDAVHVPAGTYVIEVIAYGDNGTSLRNRAEFVFTVEQLKGPRGALFGELAFTGQSLWLVVGVAIAAIGSSAMLLVWRRRRHDAGGRRS